MIASRVRLVLLAWVVALLVIASASWAAMTDPRSATDWRFNRARVDAELVVSAFGRPSRDEVDLGRLRHAVVGVIVEAVRPVRAALWLLAERPVVSGGGPEATDL